MFQPLGAASFLGPPTPGVKAVKQFWKRLWHEEDGVLSFEWTLLTSLLTVGVVSGIASVRDAAVDEMGDLAQAMIALDQSYQIQPPLAMQVHTVGFGNGFGFGNVGFGGFFGGFNGVSAAAGSSFVDAAAYQDCYRAGTMKDQEFPRRAPQAPAAPPGENQPMAAPDEEVTF